MEDIHENEEELLRSAALQNARSILAARQRAEEEIVRAKEALELRTADLARSLSMVQATIESTTDGILATDDAGYVTNWNEKYARMWRIPAELLDTRDHRKILRFLRGQLKEPERFEAGIEAIYDSSPPESFDVLELADGRIFERFSKIQCVDRESVGRIWSFRDITERRIAEKEHAYLAAIVASSNDAIIGKTLGGTVTSWNSAAERIFGYTAGEAIGKPIAFIVPPDRLEEERSILERLGRGESIEHLESVRLRKDGRRIHVSLTISLVKDGEGRIAGASTIARDVTEREQLLAREQAARAQAEQASRMKDEFLATISHELRTPLNAILGWAHILRLGHLDESKAQHAAEVVERNARTQAQMIEDLLDVSRIIAGKLRLDVRPVMPAVPIEAAMESVSPMAEAKGVRLHSILDQHAGPISGDPGRLQQVVWNLLVNAIKFTPRGGRAEIRLERVDSNVEIIVTDSGEGMLPQFLPHVFDRFSQADASSARTTGGLGLGLAIVRHLVELHGGRVAADSPGKGRGATFTVKLPLRPILPRDDQEPSTQSAGKTGGQLSPSTVPNLQGARVLVVDDEADTRGLLREVLERCGAHVRDVGSAHEALEHIKEWRPMVIVSDIGMPGEDGYALIRQVREWERGVGAWTPAVALTAYARGEDRMKALAAGYQVHAAKPIDPMEFAFVVAGVVQQPAS